MPPFQTLRSPLRTRLSTSCRQDQSARICKSAAWFLLAAAFAWALCARAPVQAQAERPNVEVDLSALDALGPAKPVPENERVVLRPPRALTAPEGTAEAARAPAAGSPAPAAETAAATAVPKAPPSAGTDGPVRLVFAKESADLPQDAAAKLAPLAARMKQDQRLRVELFGYAPGEGTAAREARRLSLSRALAVRLFLTKQGIGGSRALVRPLGNETKEEPVDRVDVVVMK